MRILVRSPNWIGDQILAYPFFYYLRKTYPSARIVSACLPWVQSIQFRNLVDDVLLLPTPLKKSLGSKWSALENGAVTLRNEGPWDLGFCLPNSFSSAWLMYRSHVKRRRGYGADGRDLLLNEKIRWNEGRIGVGSEIAHRAEAYIRLLPEAVLPKMPIREFWGVPSVNELDPGIPGVLATFDAEKEWPRTEVVEPPQSPYWVLAPGATAESRRWSVEQFAALAREVARETGWTGIVIGGPGEAELGAYLADDEDLKLLNWTVRGTVASYWKVFRGAQFSVCNDSGLAHVASLCGSPVQVIWGGGDPKRTEPLGPGRVRLMINPVSCWPCERNFCDQTAEKKLECLKGISAESVWSEIKSGMRLQW